MGIIDKAKQFASDNPDKVEQGIERAGDEFDKRTGDKYADTVDKVQDAAKDKLGGEAPQE
ncbi:antitoxin [Corynebacterium sp.]|uniref:antitoxin n=1 Tax=Corynebacterium sp. TaxID=1720 RepID=UPI0026DB8F7E|nr:antitoxin [Corynebacterium sp.]MDO4611111.1 antitoxin [Corynebacterium sp.]